MYAALENYTWIFVTAMVVAFINGYSIGANDVANAFSTSVASKSITLIQAIIIASIMEFSGAYFLGQTTATTIISDIIEIKKFEPNPALILIGMTCALIAASIWTMIATVLAIPVSTTHSIIGAMIGIGASSYGFEIINWNIKKGVPKIFISWFVSPLVSGFFASFIFLTSRYFILNHQNSLQRGLKAIPFYFGLTLSIDILFILIKTKNFKNGLIPIWALILIVLLSSILVGLFAHFFYVNWMKRILINDEDMKWYHIPISPFVKEQPKLSDLSEESGKTSENNKKSMSKLESFCRKYFKFLYQDVHKVEGKKLKEIHGLSVKFDDKTEYMYGFLQVFSACMSSFAHGSNDVANSAGPLSSAYHTWKTGTVVKSPKIEEWILMYGGFAIIIGLITYGYKLIHSLGTKIIFISPSRGFSIELGAALTVISASFLQLPVSSTHCIVGATAAIGLCNGTIKSLNWKMLSWILLSCIITVPFTALISGSLFSFATRSPKL